MANTILIKHGSGIPTSSNLKSFELGYSTTEEKLYINQNGIVKEAVKIPDATPIGIIAPYAGIDTTIPSNWHICDGSTLNKNDYPELFAIIGTTYGSNSSDTFNLPNLQGRTIIGAGNYIENENNITYSLGEIDGSAFINEVPSHKHDISELSITSSAPNTNNTGGPSTANTGSTAPTSGYSSGYTGYSGTLSMSGGNHRHSTSMGGFYRVNGSETSTYTYLSNHDNTVTRSFYTSYSGNNLSVSGANHRHSGPNHNHTISSHTHSLSNHTHSLNNHTHTISISAFQTQSTGNSNVSNMMPYIALNYIIKVK